MHTVLMATTRQEFKAIEGFPLSSSNYGNVAIVKFLKSMYQLYALV